MPIYQTCFDCDYLQVILIEERKKGHQQMTSYIAFLFTVVLNIWQLDVHKKFGYHPGTIITVFPIDKKFDFI